MDGTSTERNVPLRWSPTENIAWRVPLPGPAGSTPVVWDDRIYLTSVDSDGQLLLLCLGTDGKQKWKQVVTQGNRDVRGDEGNLASPSPSTDGQHVWTLMGNGILACYTNDGKEVWKIDLQERYFRLNIQFGYASTPVLDKGRLYLQLIHGNMRSRDEEAWLLCLESATGQEVWRYARKTGATNENKHSYSSPSIYRDRQREFLVTHGGDYVTAHQLTDGGELWRYCLNPKGALYHPTLRFVASPLVADGFIVAPSAKKGPVVCVKADAQGDISENEAGLRWRIDKGTPDVPSPLYHNGLVYLCREDGVLVCVDAQSGKQLYENRTTSDRHRASPVFADGRIYLTARNGIITVVEAGPSFKILAQNGLGEVMTSSPVVSNGRIYLRTFQSLYAIGGNQAGAAATASE
jgi:outer membrane protein assembly factor BamB